MAGNTRDSIDDILDSAGMLEEESCRIHRAAETPEQSEDVETDYLKDYNGCKFIVWNIAAMIIFHYSNDIDTINNECFTMVTTDQHETAPTLVSTHPRALPTVRWK